MKKLFGKSFLALVLAMTMLMGMSLTVMAAEPCVGGEASDSTFYYFDGAARKTLQKNDIIPAGIAVYGSGWYKITVDGNEIVNGKLDKATRVVSVVSKPFPTGTPPYPDEDKSILALSTNLSPAPVAPGTCPDCKGQGKIKCAEPNCEDGKIKCDGCNGRGKYMCTNRNHPFKSGSCPDCGGVASGGEVICKKCLGAKTEDCPACKGGYNTCKTCGGTGSIGGDSYSTPSAPTIPTDYVAERVAEEEAMEVSPVTVDKAQYGAGEAAVVPATSYNLSKFVTTKGIVKGIKTAVEAANNNKKDVAEIYTGKPFCFNKEIIKAIQEGNKTVVYYFAHEGHIYSVTVPATVDAAKVLEQAGFAGPLYVGQQLGTTKLIK